MDAYWVVMLFAVGTCIGSFLNVVVYRLPRGESIVFPSSHCPHCGRAIKWYDNIPIVSFLLLRGRCRFCKAAISPRYLVVELLTAVLVCGLYVCYFMLELRDGAGHFASAWPMFAAHAVLLCGLLASSVVDIQLFIVPLPVMWFCAGVGIVAAAFRPHPFMPPASAAAALASVGAIVGLFVGKAMLHLGWLQESFLDAEDEPSAPSGEGTGRPESVAISASQGVDPRREILRELLFLTPAIVLAVGGWFLATRVPAVREPLAALLGGETAGRFGTHLACGMGGVFGLLVGGALIWGTRILGTLAFGREAMGMGDVHILAAIGAVAGWQVGTLTFFAAPLFGLVWALHLLISRGRRELPYGPWLAVGALVVMLFYDGIVGFIVPGR